MVWHKILVVSLMHTKLQTQATNLPEAITINQMFSLVICIVIFISHLRDELISTLVD